MKIIKHGFVPEVRVKTYRGTCDTCGCIVEVTEKEAHRCLSPKGVILFVTCPTVTNHRACLQTVVVKEHVIRELTENFYADDWRFLAGEK